jgi:hypothetical protein
MSHDGHVLLTCNVTDPTPTAGHTENTACSIVTGAYRVYRSVARQRFDQMRHNIRTKYHEDCYRRSSNIKVFSQQFEML